MFPGDPRRLNGPVEGPDPNPEPTGEHSAAEHGAVENGAASAIEQLGVGSIHQDEVLRRDRSPYWLPLGGGVLVALILLALVTDSPTPEVEAGPDSTMALRMLTTAATTTTTTSNSASTSNSTSERSVAGLEPEVSSELEAVAESFATAFVNLDADAALAVLHPQATDVDLSVSDRDDLRAQFAVYEATDVMGEVHGCEALLPEGRVSCIVRTSDRLSRVEDRMFLIDLRMEVEDGLVTAVVMNRFAKRQWVAEYWDYFVAWSTENRPEETAVAYPNGTSDLPDVSSPHGRAAFDSLLDEYHAAFSEEAALGN